MNRADYEFDPAVAAIVDDKANQISLGSMEMDYPEPDPLFFYLQKHSTVRHLRYAIQELRLDQNSQCSEPRFKNPEIYTKLIEYAQSKIVQLNEENAWFRNSLSRLGHYLNSVARYAFLITYEFDGYDSNSEHLTTAIGGTHRFLITTEEKDLEAGSSTKKNTNQYSSLGVYLASFFGIPSRPSGLSLAENYHLSFRQLLRNFFGGWNPLNQPTRNQGYIIHSIEGDGDCGFTAIHTTRDTAIVLLTDDNNLQKVKDILTPLLEETFLEASERQLFYNYLISKNIITNDKSFDEFTDSSDSFIHDNNIVKAYIHYELGHKRNFAHSLILAAVGKIQRKDVHIWKLDSINKLIPNPQYAHNIFADSTKREDLLFVDNNHFESLEFKGFPQKGPAEDAEIYPWSEWTSKKVLQLLAIPLKLLIIFPVKILMIPVKLAVNLVKLLTEFIPFIMSLILLDTILFLAKKRSADDKSRWVRYGYSILIGITSIFYAVFKIWHLLGRAFSSPTKSARRAYAYFSDLDGLKFRLFGKKFEGVFSTLVGGFFMLISLAVSITLWTILLPFAFSYLAPHVTTLLQTAASTFPTIAKAITTVAQWPALSVPFKAINSALTAAGTYLSSTFAFSTTFTFLSSLVSVQLPAYFLATAVAIGTLVVPALTFFSWAANKLSDLWAYWGSFEQNNITLNNELNLSESNASFSSISTPIPDAGAKKLIAMQAALQQQSQKASLIGNYFNAIGESVDLRHNERDRTDAVQEAHAGLDSKNDFNLEVF